ncbi:MULTISPECIES: hypothetical protein [Pseudomonas]|jgi:hypothetical protein|uniref:hypothetical protein n=1 Tax=Pseudomonas TaxID=286 RepID=UPI001CA530E6|nr:MULTISPECIES: hypothetical protein [Pseudomonas]WEX18153.1 hypothetical protein P2T68_12840 [Pseudomonas sp. G11]
MKEVTTPRQRKENRLVHIHIIYTHTKMLLSKKPYSSWVEIQNQYPDYLTSLGPWDDQAVIEYLADEYCQLSPPPKEQVAAFIAATEETTVLTFSG